MQKPDCSSLETAHSPARWLLPRASCVLTLLFVGTITLASQLALWREQSDHHQAQPGTVLQVLMGDSRRLFANHFVTKADVYLHSGVYPSIFDQAARARKLHLAEAAAAPTAPGHETHAEADQCEHPEDDDHDHANCAGHPDSDAAAGFLGKPRDWIDAFGRNFYPTQHTHLDQNGKEREMLPWLRLAAELNPNDVQVYTLGAYWLRSRMGRVKEAEAFLREGWTANPRSYEILFELGRLYQENRQDTTRARNLLVAALKRWQETEPAKEKPDEFSFMQIIGHLARLEQRDGRIASAVAYLQMLQKLSPNPESIQQQIDALRSESNVNQ